MGRPPIIDSPEKFEELTELYFEGCKQEDAVPTVNGLCLTLGMTRETLLRYEEKPDFSDTVKKARMRLEMAWEQRLAGPNAAGTIFWLKNQGWSDKTEQVVTATVEHGGSVTLEPGDAYLRMLNGG
jgi:hypothetical protein